MPKKIILVLVAVIFFSRFSSAFASLTINEIMYDLSGSDSANNKSREWIEIYNSGSADVSIDASKWRFYDGGANRTINGGANFIIPANSYVIFAGDKDTFLLDHPGFVGVVYDTGFASLNNTNATLKILDQDGNAVDEIAYTSSQGGSGNGNSLQKISSSWSGATPTPGIVNETTTLSPPSADNSNSSENGSDGITSSFSGISLSEASVKTTEIQKIKTKITAKTPGFVGLPISLDVATSGTSGEQLHYGKYFWNFGDGDSKEVNLADSQSFAHTYFYPGEYIVSLDYFSSPYIYSNVPDASDRIIIKIVGTDISISRIGDEKDFFVELSNNTDFSADLSNWFLSSAGKSFKIPRNTVLASKKKMIISPKITNFSITDKDTLKLINSSGEVVFDYFASVAPVVVNQEILPLPARPAGGLDKEGNEERLRTSPPWQGGDLRGGLNPPHLNPADQLAGRPPLNEERAQGGVYPNVAPVSPVENLSALALSGESAEQNEKNPYSFPIIPLASFIFIGASAGAVYFIRRKKVIAKTGDDFEILDE